MVETWGEPEGLREEVAMVGRFVGFTVLAGGGDVIEGGYNNNFRGVGVSSVFVACPAYNIGNGGGNPKMCSHGFYADRAKHREGVETCGFYLP